MTFTDSILECGHRGISKNILSICLYVDVVIATYFLISRIYQFHPVDDNKDTYMIMFYNAFHKLLAVMLYFFFLEICLFFLLHQGLANESYPISLQWMICKTLLSVLTLGFSFAIMYGMEFACKYIIEFCVQLVYTLFELIAAYQYVSHLKKTCCAVGEGEILRGNGATCLTHPMAVIYSSFKACVRRFKPTEPHSLQI